MFCARHIGFWDEPGSVGRVNGSSVRAKRHRVGNGISVSVDTAQPLRLAYFAPSENSFLRANLESLRETAAKVGAEIQFFDSGWSATKEFNQIQNAIQSGRFNAFLVQPLDGQLLCKILSDDAPKAGILVSITVVQLCNRGTLSGAEQWAPGTTGVGC